MKGNPRKAARREMKRKEAPPHNFYWMIEWYQAKLGDPKPWPVPENRLHAEEMMAELLARLRATEV